MNRSKIEWCDYTWNPITGCRHNCSYCYAKRMTARFAGDVRLNKMAKKDYTLVSSADSGEDLYVLDDYMANETGEQLVYPFGFDPTLHRYRMDYPQKIKMGNNIFVGSMADIFGDWVPDEWIDEIMETCEANPIHNYLFLTKNPERYIQYGVPTKKENMWYGTTVTRRGNVAGIDWLPDSSNVFVSIEPLLEDIEPENNTPLQFVNWIIIGAETGRRKDKIVPEREWIEKIVAVADKNSIPVFMKKSLVSIMGEENMRREFPERLQCSEISPKMRKRLFDVCSECKVHLKKSEMIALLARSKRGEQPKQFGFMCRNCFKQFCKSLGLNVPALAELAESATVELKEMEEK